MKRIFLYALGGLVAAPLAGMSDAWAGVDPIPGSPAATVTECIDAALVARGIADHHRVELDSPLLSLPKGVSAEALHVESLTLDPKTGRLGAVLAPAEGKERVRLAGHVYELIDAIVPARVIEPGEIIAERDLEHTLVQRDPAGQDPLAEVSALIGKTPRHQLRAREPVHPADLQSPLVIHRGELVTMTVETPMMTVSAQGQALEDAARGAAVRVTNPKSNRVIEAVATGPGTAAVDMPMVP